MSAKKCAMNYLHRAAEGRRERAPEDCHSTSTTMCRYTHAPILKHSIHNAQNEPITGILLLLQHLLVQALCILHINMHDKLITYFK